MGAADGAVFAPVPEGAVSQIVSPPCPCKECAPGDGIDHVARRRNSVAVRRARMRELLQEQDFRNLNADEEEELDGLLHLYLHDEA